MSTPSVQPASGTKASGVRINCMGDRKVGRAKYEEVEISQEDYVFCAGETSDIAERIGFPIFMREYRADSGWSKERADSVDFTNPDALWLYLCCDPSDSDWGATPWHWDRTGSVLVVRRDKKKLHAAHVEALCTYCSDLQSFFGHALGIFTPGGPMSKDAVLAMIHRPAFAVHWCKMETESRQARFSGVPGPYEM